jgi:hypothetical protein
MHCPRYRLRGTVSLGFGSQDRGIFLEIINSNIGGGFVRANWVDAGKASP